MEVLLTCDKPNISWTTGKTLERVENGCKAGHKGLPGSLACVLIVFKLKKYVWYSWYVYFLLAC